MYKQSKKKKNKKTRDWLYSFLEKWVNSNEQMKGRRQTMQENENELSGEEQMAGKVRQAEAESCKTPAATSRSVNLLAECSLCLCSASSSLQ